MAEHGWTFDRGERLHRRCAGRADLPASALHRGR
jgi:hypothetical protein